MRVAGPLICLLLLLAATAAAESRQQASELLRLGNALHRAGDYRGALEQYRRARALFPSYRLGFNIGMTLAALGQDAAAADELERFLRAAREVAEREMADRARRTLVELQARVGRLSVGCPVHGAEVLVDASVVGRTPLRGWLHLRPGTHTLVVRAPGWQAYTLTLILYPGDHPRVTVSLIPLGADRSIARRGQVSTPIYRRWWFWTAIGAVIIGGAVAGGVAGYHYSGRVPSGELQPDLVLK